MRAVYPFAQLQLTLSAAEGLRAGSERRTDPFAEFTLSAVEGLRAQGLGITCIRATQAVDEETFEQLRALMLLAREHGLSELSFESAEAVVRLRRGGRRVVMPRRLRAAVPAGAAVAEIRAPLLGVFYRAPAPEAPPYVEAGDWIQPGQTVGLIEAMKVFNEINSEIEGRVVEVVAQSGGLVQAGDALLVIELAA